MKHSALNKRLSLPVAWARRGEPAALFSEALVLGLGAAIVTVAMIDMTTRLLAYLIMGA